MKSAIYDLLSEDATLIATLTGGIYCAGVDDVQEISRQATPDAYDDNMELLPCLLIRQETQVARGPHANSSVLYVTVWFYQRAGYTAIETARKRVYTLLHEQKLTPDDGSGNYLVRHANDLLDLEDPALGVPMAMSRYQCWMER